MKNRLTQIFDTQTKQGSDAWFNAVVTEYMSLTGKTLFMRKSIYACLCVGLSGGLLPKEVAANVHEMLVSQAILDN